jgi:hypothetical protein
VVVVVILLLTLISSSAFAEVRMVHAEGEYRMGDRDTREDAIRLATEAAKRHALEQVAVYLQSVTVVDDMDVTKDEIRTYTAGLVLVLDQQVSTSLDGDSIVVKVALVAQIDSEEVAQAIAALRENEDARRQLVALRQENEQLQRDLEVASQALLNATSYEQTQLASQQRQELLNRAQSNAMVAQAWTDYVLVSPVGYPYASVGIGQSYSLLNAARTLSPTSPHVQIAQQVIPTQPPPPSQPTMTPPTGSTPAQRPAPLTLNEISHTTSTAPPHIGNQSITPQPTTLPISPGSRTLTDVRHLNPLLPPPVQNGTQSVPQSQLPNTRSARALQQFLLPPPTASGQAQTGQPPIARRLPPTINQRPSLMPQQVPRMPHHFAPRSFGGAGLGGARGGGGRGSGGGGGRGR